MPLLYLGAFFGEPRRDYCELLRRGVSRFVRV